MTACLCVWWWTALRARARGQRFRGGVAAALAALLLCLPPPALANPEQQHDNEQRDGQSRHEQKRIEQITLTTGDGELIVLRIVLITSTSAQSADVAGGVRFESLDRIDVSAIPVLGGLFKRPLQAGDLNAGNRIGAVYDAGDGTLAAVLDEGVDPTDRSVSIVNGKGRFDLLAPPQKATVLPADLGPFGELPSVRAVLNAAAPSGTTMVLGGLTQSSVPDATGGLPVLGDVPLLQSLFRGTVHQRDERELLVLIKPSIILQEEEN